MRRNVALKNLNRAFPANSTVENEIIFKKCWRHFLRVGAELARLPDLDSGSLDKNISFPDMNVLEKAIKQDMGVIAVSAHIGNWEWMGSSISSLGHDVTYVVTSQSNPLVENWMNEIRQVTGINTVHKRSAAKVILKALKKKGIVAMLCDQNAGKSGTFTPFFGTLASTPRGPAVFHLKTRAPVVFVSATINRDDKYTVTCEELQFQGLTGDLETDENLIMAQITSRIENEVRKFPEQWLWLHRRWKTRPPSEIEAA